jgi:hypothetical protein
LDAGYPPNLINIARRFTLAIVAKLPVPCVAEQAADQRDHRQPSLTIRTTIAVVSFLLGWFSAEVSHEL